MKATGSHSCGLGVVPSTSTPVGSDNLPCVGVRGASRLLNRRSLGLAGALFLIACSASPGMSSSGGSGGTGATAALGAAGTRGAARGGMGGGAGAGTGGSATGGATGGRGGGSGTGGTGGGGTGGASTGAAGTGGRAGTGGAGTAGAGVAGSGGRGGQGAAACVPHDINLQTASVTGTFTVRGMSTSGMVGSANLDLRTAAGDEALLGPTSSGQYGQLVLPGTYATFTTRPRWPRRGSPPTRWRSCRAGSCSRPAPRRRWTWTSRRRRCRERSR